LTEEIQIAVDDNPTRKKAVHKVVFGNIVIKNRLKTLMHKHDLVEQSQVVFRISG
jgi:hypothetical protein